MRESKLIDLFGLDNDPLKESQLDDLLFRLESKNSTLDQTLDHLAGFPLSFTITVSGNCEPLDGRAIDASPLVAAHRPRHAFVPSENRWAIVRAGKPGAISKDSN